MSVKPKQVAIISAAQGATWRYGCAHVREQLHYMGINSFIRQPGEAHWQRDLEACDAIILHRVAHDRCIAALIQRLRVRGIPIIFSADDLIFSPAAIDWVNSAELHDALRAASYRRELSEYQTVFAACDAVLAYSGYLAAQARAHGQRAWVQRLSFNAAMETLSQTAYKQQKPRQDARVVIGYASGSPTHDRDFQQVRPVLQRILQQYPQTELWLVGHLQPSGDWGVASARVRRLPFVAWQELPALYAQFSINLAPLELDNPFCQAKSENKYVEAGLVRTPTIASPIEAFTHAIRTGETGLLAATPAAWESCLTKLITEPELRRELGLRAYADVTARYHPARRGRSLVAMLNQIGTQVYGRMLWKEEELSLRQPLVAGWRETETPTPPRLSLLRRALYALRYRGPRVFLMQLWGYLQSRLSAFST